MVDVKNNPSPLQVCFFSALLLILTLTVSYIVKKPDIVALSSIPEKNDNNARIFIFRHGERCDRSDNQCISKADGITLVGAEQAINNGEMFNASVSDYAVYSTNTTRTIQTAKYFSGKAVTVLPELSICDGTIFNTLKKVAEKNKNTVIFTHNHCISFIASHMKKWKFKPGYLDGLVMTKEKGKLILDGRLAMGE
ncbi:TPA: lipopolysaccharide core heptose(II)-phosphate phosphatase [Escherichia coli]|uniref:lipopolysaccharide core heptose(II)-phosphate phosphatase n=1 Tax=Escherichia coli TaxID=562 RepID=UPI001571C775|nr:lipopolysaccharide core heptose(II)-phosphate phosphatase [Escherichia coli]EJA0598796.1 lipopolysaccharide core heptose(II)-phosphate phosphatase [Escherichia coli]MDA6991269.1 lipopolysaccharide core heptose(II)-phosphate phosphatase [Escherichia coli]MDC3576379.1 lipopolysaccharide core heptose(II)-phosphate phosphatase [Escherichia coli]MDF3971410.1 lipopolysaccharide core heptose(II)-phosphate phosphatase [Escherichia coli]NSW40325.1 lipopolysaccharide core heptose(II)-phosphate phosph